MFNGKISDAERALSRMSRKFGVEEKGYIEALNGIYQAYVSGDEETFLFKLWKRSDLRKRRNEITNELDRLSRSFVDEERRGFFRAWKDFIKIMDKLPTPHKLREKQK